MDTGSLVSLNHYSRESYAGDDGEERASFVLRCKFQANPNVFYSPVLTGQSFIGRWGCHHGGSLAAMVAVGGGGSLPAPAESGEKKN
jgi:hypothetical protein